MDKCITSTRGLQGHRPWLLGIVAALLAGVPPADGFANANRTVPDQFIAIAEYTNIANRPGHVLFFSIESRSFVGAITTTGFPEVARSPGGRGFLVATQPRGTNHPSAIIREWQPHRPIRMVHTQAWLGNPVSPPGWRFKVGPDGLLWLFKGTKICAVLWPTMKVVAGHDLRTVAASLLFPVAGGAIFVDFHSTRDPKASTRAVPKMSFMSEGGSLSRLMVPATLHGVPWFMAARGRTLSGITAFSHQFVTITIGHGGKIKHILERPLAKPAPRHVMAFHFLHQHEGIALILPQSKSKKSQLFYVDTQTGKVLHIEDVNFRAHDFAVCAGHVYLVGHHASVAEVGPNGKILWRSPPPGLVWGVVVSAP